MTRLWQSLRGRVVLGMLGVALVPTLVLSWANFGVTNASLQAAAEAQVRAVAVRAAAETDAFHARTLDYLRTLSRLAAVETFAAGTPASRTAQRAATRRLLMSLRALDQVYVRSVGITDADGRLLLDDGGHTTTDVWILGEEQEIKYTSLPAMSRVTTRADGVFLEAAAPVMSGDRIAGYLVLRFDAAILQSLLERQRVVDRAELISWMNDEMHIRLAGETPTMPLLTSPRRFGPALRDSLVALGLLRLDAPSVKMIRKVDTPTMLPDSTAIFRVTETYVDSTRVLIGAAAPLRSRPWVVYAATPARLALAPARALLLQAAGLGLILALVVLLLALASGRRLTAPLADLAHQARRIADGDFSARVTVSRSQELGELGLGFNTLAERVGGLVSALAERTHELELDIQERARLEHELSDARRLEAVGRLAGGVAHDFNNLLTVVIANLSMAEESLPPGAPELLEVRAAREAAARGAELTKQLLAFSRRGVVTPKVIDLSRTVRNLEPLLRRLVGETVTLTIDADNGVLAVMMDPTQCDQVVMNLAANARDAMPSGGALHVAVRQVATELELLGLPAGRYAELTVRDSGEGMSPDTLARAFEPFFTTKALGHGTGLGLATVYGIVTRANGSVHIQSAPSGGTTFVVRLPISAELPEPDSGPRHLTGARQGRGETIVLAEDNAMVRDATARLLRDWGYHVVEAADGEAALEAVVRVGAAVRLVVSDVLMPRLDGVAMRRRIHEVRPELPVLLMSGNPPDDTASLQRSGEFMAKPYDNAQLARRVHELLNRNSARR